MPTTQLTFNKFTHLNPKKGEEIVWTDIPHSHRSILLYKPKLIISILVTFALYLIGSSFFFMISLFYAIFHLYRQGYKLLINWENVDYIITNQRIIFSKNSNTRKYISVSLKDVSNIEWQQTKDEYEVEFYGKSMIHPILSISRIKNKKELKNILREQLSENGLYSGITDQLKKLTLNNDLKYISCYQLKGKIGNLKLHLRFNGTLLEPQGFILEIECPNPENNSFLIAPKTITQKVGSLLNGQNLQIGNSDFDEAFQLKTTNPPFLLEILTPDVQHKMLRRPSHLKGNFGFGPDAQSNMAIKKKKQKDSDMILDMHILQENAFLSTNYEAGQRSVLTYFIIFSKSLKKTPSLIPPVVDTTFKSGVALGQAIEAYYRKK